MLDAGVYEMQLFWSIDDFSNLNVTACDDYFAIVQNDIKLESPLLAAASIRLLPEGMPICHCK